ncbi:hypothetical protein GUJ93_ZPchr0483g7169 [Zizania palustris]|uniref:Uncharacterized protein n=1 Tax=Zizania palustris TaxID=103762 RepID=A0A8J5RE55_ZIZPA|nr:hypothetical protein GUJ93_ZPchr0483g7169 [Zizania palustris]
MRLLAAAAAEESRRASTLFLRNQPPPAGPGKSTPVFEEVWPLNLKRNVYRLHSLLGLEELEERARESRFTPQTVLLIPVKVADAVFSGERKFNLFLGD